MIFDYFYNKGYEAGKNAQKLEQQIDQNRRLHDMYQYGKAYGYTEAKDEIGEIDLDDLDPSIFEEVES